MVQNEKPKAHRWGAGVWVRWRSWCRGLAVLRLSRVKNPWSDHQSAVSPWGGPGVLLRWLRAGSFWPTLSPAELHAADHCREKPTHSQIHTWAFDCWGRAGPSASLHNVRNSQSAYNKLTWTLGSKRDAECRKCDDSKAQFLTVSCKPAAWHKRRAAQLHFQHSLICQAAVLTRVITDDSFPFVFILFTSRSVLVRKSDWGLILT